MLLLGKNRKQAKHKTIVSLKGERFLTNVTFVCPIMKKCSRGQKENIAKQTNKTIQEAEAGGSVSSRPACFYRASSRTSRSTKSPASKGKTNKQNNKNLVLQFFSYGKLSSGRQSPNRKLQPPAASPVGSCYILWASDLMVLSLPLLFAFTLQEEPLLPRTPWDPADGFLSWWLPDVLRSVLLRFYCFSAASLIIFIYLLLTCYIFSKPTRVLVITEHSLDCNECQSLPSRRNSGWNSTSECVSGPGGQASSHSM